MATRHFLDDYVKDIDKSSIPKNREVGKPWYNAHGDCIIYLGVNEETIADRVDEFLTLYRCRETDRVVGFQIKGVLGLIGEFGLSSVSVSATLEDSAVTSISMKKESGAPLMFSLTELLLAAFGKQYPPTIRTREGYCEALESRSDGEKILLA